MKVQTLKWHPSALADLSAIVEYCSISFGRKTAREVRNKLVYTAELLCANPCLGPIEPLLKGCTSLEYRSIVANNYTKIIYTVHHDYVYIHLLWDVRQDEERISKVISNRYTLLNQEYNNIVNEPSVTYGRFAEES